MSLKELLHNKIHEMGYLGYGEMVDYCLELGFKPSNAERRLRELCALETPEIAAITKKSKRNTDYISGWEWIAAPKREEINASNWESHYPLPPAFAPKKETKNQLL